MNATERARLLGLSIPNAPTPAETPKNTGTFYTYDERDDLKRALAPLSSARVNALPKRDLKASRKLGDSARADGLVAPLNEALCYAFQTDAHMQVAVLPAFVHEDCSPRFAGEAIKYGAEIGALVFDFDLVDHGASRMTPSLFRELIADLTRSPMLSGAVFHATRGGLRAIRPLAQTFTTRVEGGRDWRAFYRGVVDRLPQHPRGKWDASCDDVPRLIRLPWVTRDDEAQRGEFWVASVVEPYHLTDADRSTVISASLPRDAVDYGIEGDGLIDFFRDIGMLIREHTEINGAPSYCVQCPFDQYHSSTNETSTILMHTESGYTLHCLHASCQDHISGGGWRRHLQTTYPDQWDECLGAGERQYIYHPDDHIGFVNASVAVLSATFPDRIFRRHDTISTVERDPYGGARWRSYSVADITGLLNRFGNFVTRRSDRGGNVTTVPTSIPERMVKIHLLAIAEELPECLHSTTLPPLDPETLEPTRYAEGYCPITQSYFLPHKQLNLDALRRVCEGAVTRERAILAYSELLDLYSDFPWRSNAHKALAVGVTFTAGLRRSMDIAPLMFVSANNKGVGKTKLLSASLASIYGDAPPLSTLPKREEELKKVLDSLVHTDSDAYIADNVASTIGGAVLDGFITAPRHNYRPLGVTDSKTAPNQVFLGATGNNATIGGDTDRRAILIRLVTDLQNPEARRGFKYRDLVGEAKTRTTQTWGHIITILRAWRECSTPSERAHIEETARALGSFERWCEIVRDPIMWVASLVEGVDVDLVALSNAEMNVARDDGHGELFNALIEWQSEQDRLKGMLEAQWTSNDLYRALARALDGSTGDYLEEFALTFPRLTVRRVGDMLTRYHEKVSAGHRLKIASTRGNRRHYVVECVEPSNSPPTDPPTDPAQNTAQNTELPVIQDYEWTSCETASAIQVDPRLIDQKGEHARLTKRCEYLRGEMCARQKIPCDYDGSDGGITQVLADALRATMDDELRALESPELIPRTEDARALEIISAEYAVKARIADIAKRLNAEQIPPPNGRKWTAPKVSLIAKKHQITKPKAQKKSKSEQILARDGHWSGYWPPNHPLETPNAGEDQPHETGEGWEQVIDETALLTRLYGRLMTPKQAFEQRIQRDEEEQT